MSDKLLGCPVHVGVVVPIAMGLLTGEFVDVALPDGTHPVIDVAGFPKLTP